MSAAAALPSAPVEAVAVLALAYRELAEQHYLSPDSLFDDLEVGRSVSLILMIASQALHEVDWEIVHRLAGDASRLDAVLPALARGNPARYEAVLHARPGRPTSHWPYPQERIAAIRDAMARIEAGLYTTPFDAIDAIAEQVAELAGVG